VIPSESRCNINSIISCSGSNTFDDIGVTVWMKTFNAIKYVISIGR